MALTAEITLLHALYEGPMVALGLTVPASGDVIQKNHVLGAMITGFGVGWILGVRQGKANPSGNWLGF